MPLHTRGDDVFTYKMRRSLNIQDETMSLHTGGDDAFTYRRRRAFTYEEMMPLHTG